MGKTSHTKSPIPDTNYRFTLAQYKLFQTLAQNSKNSPIFPGSNLFLRNAAPAPEQTPLPPSSPDNSPAPFNGPNNSPNSSQQEGTYTLKDKLMLGSIAPVYSAASVGLYLPIETIKNRAAVQGNTGSLVSTIKVILKNEGPSGLYKALPQTTLKLGGKGFYRGPIMATIPETSPIMRALVLTIADMVLMNIAEGDHQRAVTKCSPSQPASLREISKTYGVKQAVKTSIEGIQGTAGKYGFYWGIVAVGDYTLRTYFPWIDRQNLFTLGSLSVVYGLADAIVTTPFDVVRARLQSMHAEGTPPVTVKQAFTELWRDRTTQKRVLSTMKLRSSQCVLASGVVVATQATIDRYKQHCAERNQAPHTERIVMQAKPPHDQMPGEGSTGFSR